MHFFVSEPADHKTVCSIYGCNRIETMSFVLELWKHELANSNKCVFSPDFTPSPPTAHSRWLHSLVLPEVFFPVKEKFFFPTVARCLLIEWLSDIWGFICITVRGAIQIKLNWITDCITCGYSTWDLKFIDCCSAWCLPREYLGVSAGSAGDLCVSWA